MKTPSSPVRTEQPFLPAPAPRPFLSDGQPCFDDQDAAFIVSQIPGILRGQLSSGPWTERFEAAAAEMAGTRYAVALPSCTAALEATLTALGVGPGDEVLVPVQTFVATGMAVHLAGGRPVMCDIRPETHCLDPEEIARRAGPRTKGVVLVHMGGLITPDLPAIERECERRGLWLVEDCAHAPGAERNGRKAGSIGVAGCFSFYPTKVVTTGEGGAVTTNDERIAAVVRSLHHRGRDLEAPVELYIRAGRNNRFPEISALLGVTQLRRLDEFVALRNEAAAHYRRRLAAEAPEATVQAHPPGTRHAYWKFLVNLPPGVSRERLKTRMQERGVGLGWSYWPPLHLQPVFRRLYGAAPGLCPAAEELLARTVCLPIHPRFSEEQRERVIESFLEALSFERSQRQ
jgi:dTDP-4-amino-4,6-dideoxygalactose transaminase